MKPNVPRRHHFVPQFLLKRFAKNERIAMVSRSEPARAPIVTNTKNAAVQTDFYTITKEDGQRSTELESYLSQVEGDASATIQRMSVNGGFPPSEADKERLARFLAFQLERGQDTRGWMKAAHEHLAQMAAEGPPIELVRDDLRKRLGREPTAEEIDQHRRLSAYELPQASDALIQERHTYEMAERAEYLARFFLTRTWRLATFSTPSLLTGDLPVAIACSFPGPAGLLNADWILFPLDPMRALVLALEGGPEQPIVAPRTVADYINSCVAIRCYKWIFHRPNHNPIAGINLPARSPMVISRVGEDERLFQRRDGVEGGPNTIVVMSPFDDIPISEEVAAVLNGRSIG